jgi:hypothetical protein
MCGISELLYTKALFHMHSIVVMH